MIVELKGQEITSLSEDFPCVVKGAIAHCLQRECGRYTEEQIHRAIMNGTFQQFQWNDSALGYPEISHHYSQNITPGWKIIFTMGGENFEIHTNANGSQTAMPIYRSHAEAKKCIQDIGKQYELPVAEITTLAHNANTVFSTWHSSIGHSKALQFFCDKYPDAMQIRKDKLVFRGFSKDFVRAIDQHLPDSMMPMSNLRTNHLTPFLLSVKIDWSHNAEQDRIEIQYLTSFEMRATEVDPKEYHNHILRIHLLIKQRGIVIRKENHLEIQITDSIAEKNTVKPQRGGWLG